MSQCLQKKLSMTLKLDGVPRYFAKKSTSVLLYTVLPTFVDIKQGKQNKKVQVDSNILASLEAAVRVIACPMFKRLGRFPASYEDK